MRAQKKCVMLTEHVTEEGGCELSVEGRMNLKCQEDGKAFEGKARYEVRLRGGLKAQYS